MVLSLLNDLVRNPFSVNQNDDFKAFRNNKDIHKRPLIIHCCHHKTGTVVIDRILRAVCKHFGYNYQSCPQSALKPDTDIWMQHHSKVDFDEIDRPYRGTHMIRNPCAIVVSAYEYHKVTTEQWAQKKIKSLNNVTYKEVLNTLNFEEGMTFEIRNQYYTESSRNTINDMYNWDYENPHFLELKYEDLMTNFNSVLSNMFKHYGFSRDMIKKSLEIAQDYNIRKKSNKDVQKNTHVTNKDVDLDKWKKYFSNQVLRRKFYKTYPKDLFDKIGYESDNLNTLNTEDDEEKTN